MPETKKVLTDEECRRKDRYFCSVCGGWKLCNPRAESYNDIGFLSGSVGTRYLCVDCGTVVGGIVQIMS